MSCEYLWCSLAATLPVWRGPRRRWGGRRRRKKKVSVSMQDTAERRWETRWTSFCPSVDSLLYKYPSANQPTGMPSSYFWGFNVLICDRKVSIVLFWNHEEYEQNKHPRQFAKFKQALLLIMFKLEKHEVDSCSCSRRCTLWKFKLNNKLRTVSAAMQFILAYLP